MRLASVCLVSLLFVASLSTPAAGCTSGDLRLTNTSFGLLQICKSNQWRAVCSRDWGHLDAAVACRQLGYDGGYTQSTRSYSRNRVAVDPVEYHCTGRETDLQNCTKNTRTCSYYYVTTIGCVRRNASDPCTSGDIRLWGGKTDYEGNIEMCSAHGVWSAVSDSSWSSAGAVVACRQLGRTGTIALPYRSSKFGQRIQPMEFGGLSCTGRESSLQQCPVSGTFVTTWSQLFFSNQRDYAGVGCIPKSTVTCTNGEVRLANGYSHNNGFPEVCIDGTWIGGCISSYNQPKKVSSLICNQLGYPRYTAIDQTFFQLNRSEPQAHVSLSGYRCNGQSSELLDCVYNSSSYGISYQSSCTTNGILCCPNDTAMCFFQPRSPPPTDPITTPSAPITTPSNPTPMVPTPTDPKPTCPTTPPIDEDKAEFSLNFGTAATSFIMSSFGLRGLEEDILKRVAGDISGKCNCSFSTSALKGGFFSFGESVTYHSQVLGVSGQTALGLVGILKESIGKDPLIQHRSDIYLAATMVF